MLGQRHPDVAETLSSRGALYIVERKYGLADALLSRSRSIREDKWGQTHPDLAETLGNLAALDEMQKR